MLLVPVYSAYYMCILVATNSQEPVLLCSEDHTISSCMQFQGRAAEGSLIHEAVLDGGMGKKPRRRFLQRRARAVWNRGVSWRSETMDATNSNLSFPHTWRNGTGAVSGSFRVFLTTVHIRLPQAQGNECLLHFSVQLVKFGCLPIPYLCCYWFRLG